MLAKLEKFIFLALVFSIPFQKRTFLFASPDEASAKAGAEGFVEWNSAFFYFTDFLVFALLLFGIIRFLRFPGVFKRPLPPAGGRGLGLVVSLALLLGAAFISLTQADLINVSVYRSMKLAEFVFLFFYTIGRMGQIGLITTLWAFVASGVFQSIIAILQFAKQSSLGLEIFHESTLAIHMPNVAHIMSSDGSFLIRAYGTFPSPNVLAGFLGLCILFLFHLFIVGGWSKIKKSDQFCSTQGGALTPPLLERGGPPPLKSQNWFSSFSVLLYLMGIFFLSFGLILTFSRGTIIFFVLVSALFFAGMFLLKRFQQYREQARTLAILVIVSWLLVIAAVWPEVSSRFLGSSFDEPALQERFFFNKVGIESVKGDPMHALFGIGIGNFVHNFKQIEAGLPDYLYQPVHNIFILIASETGTLGFFAFVVFIAMLAERILKVFLSLPPPAEGGGGEGSAAYVFTMLCVTCFVLLVGMYDHYFWTLQQGGLMFWIALGLMANAFHKYN